MKSVAAAGEEMIHGTREESEESQVSREKSQVLCQSYPLLSSAAAFLIPHPPSDRRPPHSFSHSHTASMNRKYRLHRNSSGRFCRSSYLTSRPNPTDFSPAFHSYVFDLGAKRRDQFYRLPDDFRQFFCRIFISPSLDPDSWSWCHFEVPDKL